MYKYRLSFAIHLVIESVVQKSLFNHANHINIISFEATVGTKDKCSSPQTNDILPVALPDADNPEHPLP